MRPAVKYPREVPGEHLRELVPRSRKGIHGSHGALPPILEGLSGGRVEFHRLSRVTLALTSIARYRPDVRFDASVSSPRKITADCRPSSGFGLPIATRSGPENAADRHVLIA